MVFGKPLIYKTRMENMSTSDNAYVLPVKEVIDAYGANMHIGFPHIPFNGASQMNAALIALGQRQPSFANRDHITGLRAEVYFCISRMTG